MTQTLAAAIAAFQECIENRDCAGVEQFLDDDYQLVLVAPAWAIMPRERWLEVLPSYEIYEYVVEEQIVDEGGDLASVLHRVRMRSTVLGEDRSGTFVISDVWRMRDGVWRIWRRHSTPLSAGFMPGA